MIFIPLSKIYKNVLDSDRETIDMIFFYTWLSLLLIGAAMWVAMALGLIATSATNFGITGALVLTGVLNSIVMLYNMKHCDLYNFDYHWLGGIFTVIYVRLKKDKNELDNPPIGE